MPTTDDQPHANGGSKDDYAIIESSNGASAKADSADAETELVMRYIGEDYEEEKVSNYNFIDQLVKFIHQFVQDNTDKETFEKIRSSKPSEVAEVKLQSSTEDTWEKLDVVTTVTDSQIGELMKRASFFHYQAIFSDPIDHDIHLMCATLFKKDYTCANMPNNGGALCWNYPTNIFIPIGVKIKDPNSSNEDKFDPESQVPGFYNDFKTYCNTAASAAIARCRSRFPVPVILYKGKFICRSGTLAVRKGAAFEAFRKAPGEKTPLITGYGMIDYLLGKSQEFLKNMFHSTAILTTGVDEMKKVDASILKMLKIKYICDLMVEDRKVHTGMSVSSSEKVNMGKYGAFRCLRVPYPGCEFFRKYHEMSRLEDYKQLKKGLVFEWDAPEVNSTLGISEEEDLPSFSNIKWENYETWDLETLTQNYLRLILHYLKEGDGGLLVHCISGWDRTPLFICLLRVSLWADDLIHQELDVDQMAYFTIGYDWYLFGHDLPNRLRKKEEIMHFCFTFLPRIATSEYSINCENDVPSEKVLNRRKDRLEGLSKKLLNFYNECVPDEYFKELVNPEKHVDPQPAE